MLIPSLMLVPGGKDKCIMRRHLPECFLGTAPSGFTMKAGKTGSVNGPAVWPAAHSLAM